MPELPEVETVKRGLEDKVVGKQISDIEILREKSWQGDQKKVLGKKIIGVKRRAKLLLIQIEGGPYLIIHLKMTGQLVFRREITKPKLQVSKNKQGNVYDVDQLPNKYTRVIIKFDDGSTLFFNDLRVFGWIKVVNQKDLEKEMKNFSGVEPFSKEFTSAYLKSICLNSGQSIKLLLLDQKKIAGIGNIYANETLFCARIAPHKKARDLAQRQPEKMAKLHSCIVKILKKGIDRRGTTDADEAFRDIEGRKGSMQNQLLIYRKDGEKCPNSCGGQIKRMNIGGRGTFFCPKCQA